VKVVIQRLNSGKISVNNSNVCSIDKGIAVFVGVEKNDTEKDIYLTAKKINGIRIFEDENERMMFSLPENGEILLIPQFTLLGNIKNGLRPDFTQAEEPVIAKSKFEFLVKILRDDFARNVKEGMFGEHMIVDLVIDGPVTIIYDSRM
jgi:D-aminoacyl-tRNA deacylase